jgi:hypothetical protein
VPGGITPATTVPVTPKLTGGAAHLLTSAQQEFAAQLQADTGLNASVVEAWLLAEESGSAAQYYEGLSWNDWLNIGMTGQSGAAPKASINGLDDSIWDDPVTAANATAEWLEGRAGAVPGYGTPPASIQDILNTKDQSASTQISAIQQSGWASGGYPELAEVYQEVVGAGGATGTAQPFDKDPTGVPTSGVGVHVSVPNPLSPITSAVSGLWGDLTNSAAYAGLFVLALLVGGFLIVKGISPQASVPKFVPVPA